MKVTREYIITKESILISVNDHLYDGYKEFKGYTLKEAKKEYSKTMLNDNIKVVFKKLN